MGNTVAVYIRQEFTIENEQQLITGAHNLTRTGTDPDITNSAVPPHEAFVKLLMEHGVDDLADLSDTYGLRAGDSSTVLVEERRQLDDRWLSKLTASGRAFREIGTDPGGEQ